MHTHFFYTDTHLNVSLLLPEQQAKFQGLLCCIGSSQLISLSNMHFSLSVSVSLTHSLFDTQSVTHKVIVVFAQADNQQILTALGGWGGGGDRTEQKSKKFKGRISQNHMGVLQCQKRQNCDRG